MFRLSQQHLSALPFVNTKVTSPPPPPHPPYPPSLQGAWASPWLESWWQDSALSVSPTRMPALPACATWRGQGRAVCCRQLRHTSGALKHLRERKRSYGNVPQWVILAWSLGVNVFPCTEHVLCSPAWYD